MLGRVPTEYPDAGIRSAQVVAGHGGLPLTLHDALQPAGGSELIAVNLGPLVALTV